ncbi:hypothetical protein AB4455_18215 [Vibrio sp. 10N.261.46.E12]|uniref:hypothetical protein n=1 Tax=unclassified Vibrio TaxID=2614977 RepID=UPI00097885D9|nr:MULTISPECIES: hypothetical protein [unclassified Vibrio]OMO38466.1 hypothetical protein BH584_17595 [Vibrio sp. 10N.261.45.E1]PMJ26732.1 hypothetical protein BCU27_08895 [Vibrio sp. 10N.286.45.B6]PML95857.1 hypothetical protein BCT66_22650 [Vibrio sp. 10N.261.49.E11]PMM72000.1 hypothetical protein BCT48_07585 [Vibrio sp. 10N.261.46.F12]PMM90392.1 hypothetical protein BCT46_23195 [Vibrio sp. 10N.261.46.E8]
MKINALFPALFSALALMSGCSDVVSDEYSTYAQAKDERLFDRGWLPDILPEATVKIEVNNDLDANTSEGSFIINQSALSEFIGQLKPAESNNQFQFVDGDNVWVFKVGDDNLVSYTLNKREG